jgi:hypothetical protein
MDSYLIRIYRREKDNPEGIVGIVEEISSKKKQPFKSLSELSVIITMPEGSKANQAGVKNRRVRERKEEKSTR